MIHTQLIALYGPFDMIATVDSAEARSELDCSSDDAMFSLRQPLRTDTDHALMRGAALMLTKTAKTHVRLAGD
jgi:hypothetical protein